MSVEAFKLDGSVVIPQYGVNRQISAGSRGAYGLALIVDALYEAVRIAGQRRKRPDFVLLRHCRRYRLCSLANRATGVLDRRFGDAYDLSSVIDSGGLRVISAQRRESRYLTVPPEKPTTGFFRAKGAHVFTVRIWNRCFGHTYGFAAIVDAAVVGPAVVSSKRAEVDVASVDAYYRSTACNGRGGRLDGRVDNSIHVLRPALIIEPHDHAEVVRAVVKAQIGNLVALLSEHIAEATQNNRRHWYPEILQLSQHISSFPRVKS